MLQSNLSVGQERPLWMNLSPAAARQADPTVSDTQVGDALALWTHKRSGGATLQLQSYVDLSHRQESIGTYDRHTVDLDAVYHSSLGAHDLVIGGGYRFISDAMDGGVGYSFSPNHVNANLLNAFAQDELRLARRVALTLGAKFEHDTNEVSTLQPTARIMWDLEPKQHVWAAVSRALRTPSLVDEDVRLDLPPTIQPAAPGTPQSNIPVAISVFGNPSILDERLLSTEAGYRIDIGSRAALDVAGFIDRYQDLETNEPAAPTRALVNGSPVIDLSSTFENLLDADTRGVEVTARVTLTPSWRADRDLSAFHLTPHPDAASHDPSAPAFDGDARVPVAWTLSAVARHAGRGRCPVVLRRASDPAGHPRLHAR